MSARISSYNGHSSAKCYKSSTLWRGHTEHLSLSESDILNRVAFMLKQFVLARSFKREASKLKSSDKYNCLPIETRQLLYIDRLLFRQIQGIFGPQGKRKLNPSPPILQIMILKLSPPRCVISKESVQQNWIDDLWFRKQLCTCLFVWALNYNSWVSVGLSRQNRYLPK
jgi:hypothetical protein